MKELTKKEKRFFYDICSEHIGEEDIFTLNEIEQITDTSKATARKYVNKLIRKGLLEKERVKGQRELFYDLTEFANAEYLTIALELKGEGE